MIFAHGYGCDQNVWLPFAGALAAHHEVVLYDCAGCGASNPSLYDLVRHATLKGHAEDLVAISGKYTGMQDAICTRDTALQGSVNPVLARFGESSEAVQYSGRAAEGEWKCPFHAQGVVHN